MTSPRSTQSVLLTVILVTGAAAALVAVILAGWQAGVSALLGAVLVAMFYSSGAAALTAASEGRTPRTGLAILLLTYVLRLAIAVAVVRLVAETEALHARALGLTVLACAAAWPVVQFARVRRMPTLVVDEAAQVERTSA